MGAFRTLWDHLGTLWGHLGSFVFSFKNEVKDDNLMERKLQIANFARRFVSTRSKFHKFQKFVVHFINWKGQKTKVEDHFLERKVKINSEFVRI